MNKILLVMGGVLAALLIGYAQLAIGLLLVVGLLLKLYGHRQQHLMTQLLEAQHEPISYPFLVQKAMDWAKQGKVYFVPEGQDPDDPQLLYVGITVKVGVDGQPTFLPELEVTGAYIDKIRYLD